MKKIVLITPILQHYRLTFYEKLSKAREGYDLTVLYGYKRRDDGRPSHEGKTLFKSYGFRERKLKLFPFELVYNYGMFSAIKRIDPDIIIMQGIAGDITNRRIISWASRKRKKIIIWACGWEPGRAKGILLRFKNKLVATFFKKANYFLTYSSKASQYVIDKGVSESLVETCYNGIETDYLEKNKVYFKNKAEEIRNRYQLNNHITFLYVGGLIREKRVDLLINAFSHLRRKYDFIKLIIVGDGPLRKDVEILLEKYHDENIIYLGRIIDDVDGYFAAVDCFVLPGVGGLALNQAMYWGKQCIVSQADGTEDDLVIEGVTGYRFNKDDLSSLISAMDRRINEGSEKLKLMSENAHKIIVERSNVNNMVVHFLNGIDKMASDIK